MQKWVWNIMERQTKLGIQSEDQLLSISACFSTKSLITVMLIMRKCVNATIEKTLHFLFCSSYENYSTFQLMLLKSEISVSS